MSYYIDSSNFSIDKFRNIFKSKEILPGRIILNDRLDERFDLFERLKNTNNEMVLTKSKFTFKDIEYCIELGKELPITFDD